MLEIMWLQIKTQWLGWLWDFGRNLLVFVLDLFSSAIHIFFELNLMSIFVGWESRIWFWTTSIVNNKLSWRDVHTLNEFLWTQLDISEFQSPLTVIHSLHSKSLSISTNFPLRFLYRETELIKMIQCTKSHLAWLRLRSQVGNAERSGLYRN